MGSKGNQTNMNGLERTLAHVESEIFRVVYERNLSGNGVWTVNNDTTSSAIRYGQTVWSENIRAWMIFFYEKKTADYIIFSVK